jgi:predicted DNA-binding transcriptional regulator YafY
MSAREARDTIARQWELLQRIPTHGAGVTTSELHAQLEVAGFRVTKRTIERDLASLCDAAKFPFGPSGSQERPIRWRWIDGRAANVPGLSLAEALSLNVIENALRPLLPAALLGVLDAHWQKARDKLNDLASTNRHAAWVDKLRVVVQDPALLPPVIADGVLEAIQVGLARERQLRVSYRRAGAAEFTHMTLHPLAMVQSGTTSYLLATANDYEDVRSYAMHRFQTVEVLEGEAHRPGDFDLDTSVSKVMHFGNGRPIRLRAHVWENLADILKEAPLSDDQALGRGRLGWHVVTATVTDTWSLRRWLLGRADELVVLQPASLRRDIAAQLREAATAYGVAPDADEPGG